MEILHLGRGVPGRGVPEKKSSWAEESRAEMVLGRGVPEPSEIRLKHFGPSCLQHYDGIYTN